MGQEAPGWLKGGGSHLTPSLAGPFTTTKERGCLFVMIP